MELNEKEGQSHIQWLTKIQYLRDQYFTGHTQEERIRYYDPIHQHYMGPWRPSTTFDEYLILIENMKLEILQSNVSLKNNLVNDLIRWVHVVQQFQNYKLRFYTVVKDEITLSIYLQEGQALKIDVPLMYVDIFHNKIKNWMRWIERYYRELLHEFPKINPKFINIEGF